MVSTRHAEKLPPVASDEEDEEFSDSDRDDAVDGDAVDEEPLVMKDPNGGAQHDSPSDSVWDSDRERTPPSPALSGFTLEPIRSEPSAAAKSSAKPLKKPSGKSGSKHAAERELDGGDSRKKKKKKAAPTAAPTPDSTAAATPASAAKGDEEETKKSSGAIQRLWSEEDEIAILNGMTEYKTGSDPNSDSGAFFEFIKDALHVEVSKKQLMDKVRKLRSKYQTNAEKSENGEGLVFTNKPHESKIFELSKNIWGKTEANDKAADNSNANGSKKKAKQGKGNKSKTYANNEAGVEKPLTLGLPKQEATPKKHLKKPNMEYVTTGEAERGGAKENVKQNAAVESITNVEVNKNLETDNKVEGIVEKENVGEEKDGDDFDFWSHYPYLLDVLETIDSYKMLGSFPKRLLLEKVSGFGRDEAKELDYKWKQLRVEEMQLDIKRLNFVTELSKVILDALSSEV